MTVDDEIGSLLEQVAMGDRRAFRRLYGAIAPRLFGVCFGIVRDEAVAEEVLCDVFDRIWNWAGEMHPNGSTGTTWLITLTRDASVERLRKMRAAGQVSEPLEIAERLYHPAKGAKARTGTGSAVLQRCFEQLPEGGEAVLRAAYVQGLSYKEQAADGAENADALRSAIRRSILQLRACLSQ